MRFSACSLPSYFMRNTEPKPPSPSTATICSFSSGTAESALSWLEPRLLNSKRLPPLLWPPSRARFLRISPSKTRKVTPSGPAATEKSGAEPRPRAEPVICSSPKCWARWRDLRASGASPPPSPSPPAASLNFVQLPFSTTYHSATACDSPARTTSSPGPKVSVCAFLASSARSANSSGVSMCTSLRSRQWSLKCGGSRLKHSLKALTSMANTSESSSARVVAICRVL
mmetsp:Transcript_48063/g.137285  ORF Transcript_48063/g.137285 Transcript_48063/m.137285 type:complete len:228 (-) Transcript_48063:382-1065(-)